MKVPYARATAGDSARGEIKRLLARFGCNSVGFLDDFDEHTVALMFVYRKRRVQLKASAKGWAALYLRENPWHKGQRISPADWEARAVMQGMVAVSSILRDWVKGQVTAIETGLVPFDHVFLPFMVTGTGETVASRFDRGGWLLEAPE